MNGSWWGVVWAAVFGGGWLANRGRLALRDRHERRIQRTAAEERRRASELTDRG